MTVMILEKVSPSAKGHLSRWLLEVKAGVFVGKVSALVRDELWETVTKKLKLKGAAVQIWSTNNEQGFLMRMVGDRDRTIISLEGLQLIKRV